MTALDGIKREGWMLDAWSAALATSDDHGIALKDDLRIGFMVERVANAEGIRKVAVTVGGRRCPPAEQAPNLPEQLLAARDTLEPLEFCKQFEPIHPFVDGNGRTGKVRLNWLNGTLLEPIFPPADVFGRPIRNP